MKKHACQRVVIYQCRRFAKPCDYFEKDKILDWNRCTHEYIEGRCLHPDVLKLMKEGSVK